MKKAYIGVALRALTLVILVCMLLPQLAACNNGGVTDDSDSQPQEDTVTEVDIPENLALTSLGGFKLDGTTLTMNVASEKNTLDISNRFNVPIGSRLVLTSDEAGKSMLSDTVITLNEGDNVFYLKVSFRNESLIYKAVVNYRAAYTVEFYSNCNGYVPTQVVEKGAQLDIPTDPVREGYTFLGWYLDGKAFDFNTAPTQSCTLIGHWYKNDKNSSDYTSDKLGYGEVKFDDISAGLHVVWKDYADSNRLRPEEVICVLTQKYGSTEKTYEIVLTRDYAAWKDPSNTPSSYNLMQGEGGDWTLSLKGLPEKVGTEACIYTLRQKELSGNYSTVQSGSAVINTVKGYVPSIDGTSRLTTRNSRLYDAAGNMIVFTGVVSANLNWGVNLENTTTPAALTQLAEKGCNVLRTSVPIVGSNMYYVYQAKDGNFRTGDYNDSNSVKATEADKQKIIDLTCDLIDRVTVHGIYIIIDWTILTSNPNQYLEEACDFFGRISKKYADNPYVLYEICNEPANCDWGGANGIKAYAEKVIDVIRGNGSDAVIIVAPRGASNYISMSPAVYNKAGDKAGDDPIGDPFDDDRRYNIAYTQHPYAYENAYSDSTGRLSYGWRIRDAYDAGLTMICTELSPMAAKLDANDAIGYDFNQMAKYMRMFQEYDIGYCYFKYHTETKYTEWCMLKPDVDPATKTWTRDDLTDCGKWYYDLLTGDGVFITDIDYSAPSVKSVRDRYKTTFSEYGLAAGSDKSFFTVFPTFATDGIKQDTAYFFKVSDSDTLSDLLYKTYCERILSKIKSIDSSAASGVTAPDSRTSPMQVTYKYSGKTVTLKISYGQNATDSSWGILFDIK